jgi:hypothetical protein
MFCRSPAAEFEGLPVGSSCQSRADPSRGGAPWARADPARGKLRLIRAIT